MKTTTRSASNLRRARHGVALFAVAALLALAPHAVAADATLAEMLELGIYSEETKGDLPAAMKLYEQIVAESAADQALAAQAQFRLGMCLHKQKDYAGATAAFEQLVRDYPGQKEIVALANQYLAEGAALLPVPWVDGEETHYAIRLAASARIGLGRRSIRADVVDGRKVWHFQSQGRARAGMEWSHVVVDAATSRPLRCHWKVNVIGEAQITYVDGGAETKLSGQDDVKHTTFDGPVYDNEQAAFLMRCLPLADGYETTLKIHSGLSGGNIVDIPLRVSGPTKVTVPAGTFECLKVALKVHGTEQLFFYSNDERRQLVKLEAGGAVVEMTRVINVTDGQPVDYRDENFGFSLRAPAGWMIDRMNPMDTGESNVMLLDPTGTAAAQISVESTNRFAPEVGASARAFADYKLEQIRQRVSRLELAPNPWGELAVGDHPAVTLLAEFVQAPMLTPLKFYGIYSVIDGKTVEIWCATPPAEFDGFRPQFDAVVASYHGN